MKTNGTRVCFRLSQELRDRTEGLIIAEDYHSVSDVGRSALRVLFSKHRRVEDGLREHGWLAARDAPEWLRSLVKETNEATFYQARPRTEGPCYAA